MKPEELIAHELIGLRVTVNKIKGTVVDETKNTLIIMTDQGEKKRVLKKGSTFFFHLPDGRTVRVEGWTIQAQPWERIKRAKRLARR